MYPELPQLKDYNAEMDEFKSKLLSTKRDSKYSYIKMMEYFENKTGHGCQGLEITKKLPDKVKVDHDHAELAENQKKFQELMVSELAKAQDNIQKSMENQISALMSEFAKIQENSQKSLENRISALQNLVQEKIDV